MNVLGRTELALLPRLKPAFDDPTEQRGIEPGHEAHDLLLQQRRKQQLVILEH
ncbi:hypothetical protein D3C85_1810820 [compost metagenome]